MPQVSKESWEERSKRLAKGLSEASDVMPYSLVKHQSKIYNACLDMAYGFEKEINEALEEQRKTFEKAIYDLKPGEFSRDLTSEKGREIQGDYGVGFKEALTIAVKLLNNN